MFEFARCCRCKEPVRLPDAFASWVQCPHCDSEYPLDKILDQLPPALRVVAPPSVPGPTEDILSDADDSPAIDPSSDQPGRTSLVTKPTPTVVIDDSLPKSRVRSPDALRAQRKKVVTRNPGRFDSSMLKVFLGGVAGLCIGQLILWWLPQPYRTDPAELAPKLPTGLAFLAPASLRGEEPISLIPTNTDSDDEQVSQATDGPVTSSVDDVPSAPINAEPLLVEPPQSTRPQKIMLGAADAPTFSIRQLQAALKTAREADQGYEQVKPGGGTDETEEDSLAGWQTSMCELAHHVTYADTSEPDIKEFASTAKRFLRSVGMDPGRRSQLGEMAIASLAKADHDRTGVVVPGRVESIVKTTHYFETRLMLPHESASIVVLSRVDPREFYRKGSIVLILGVVVAEPNLYVPGYGGDESAIVFGGLPVRLK